MKICAALFAFLLLCGCGEKNPLLSTSEGKLIDAWLKDNLPDGKYEIVKWDEPIDDPEVTKKMIQKCESLILLNKTLIDLR